MSTNTPVNVSIGLRRVGTIEFGESTTALRNGSATRTPEGFLMTIPARLTLDWQHDPRRQPHVSALRAHIYVDDNTSTDLGVAFDRRAYHAMDPRGEYDLELEWRAGMETLAKLEKVRNGSGPKLRLALFGEACWAYTQDQGAFADMIRGTPERIHGITRVNYPIEEWAERMKSIGAVDNVLVEVPVPAHCPPGWEPIFAGLDEARRCLARGGEDGWKGYVVAVRLALEKWKALEPETLGVGGWGANQPQRMQWSKEERVDAVRYQIYQYAHLSNHSPAEKWKREDAVVAFTTLAALIAVRHP